MNRFRDRGDTRVEHRGSRDRERVGKCIRRIPEFQLDSAYVMHRHRVRESAVETSSRGRRFIAGTWRGTCLHFFCDRDIPIIGAPCAPRCTRSFNPRHAAFARTPADRRICVVSCLIFLIRNRQRDIAKHDCNYRLQVYRGRSKELVRYSRDNAKGT